jgi:hypothetical protein
MASLSGRGKNLASPGGRGSLGARGHSLMVKLQPSKLAMRVRFPLPAPLMWQCNATAMRSLRNPALLGVLLLSLAIALLAPNIYAEPSAAGASRQVKATDLIAAELPEQKTFKSANQIEFLSAVCAVVRRRRSSAAVITQTAVILRREFAGEIVDVVLRCVGKINCESAAAIVAAAKKAEGDPTKITDAALGKMPECAEAIRAPVRSSRKRSEQSEPEIVPPVQGPLVAPSTTPVETSSPPEEKFDPHEPMTLVCLDGTPRAVRQSLLDEFLRANPGAFLGPCPPAVSPSPTPVGLP